MCSSAGRTSGLARWQPVQISHADVSIAHAAAAVEDDPGKKSVRSEPNANQQGPLARRTCAGGCVVVRPECNSGKVETNPGVLLPQDFVPSP